MTRRRSTLIMELEWDTAPGRLHPSLWDWKTLIDVGANEAVKVLGFKDEKPPRQNGDLRWFTVFALTKEDVPFVEYYLANDENHAREQASNSAGDGLRLVALVHGRIPVLT